jgi:hypothetical protein
MQEKLAHRPLPSRNFVPEPDSRPLRLPPSEPSPDWYGSLPLAWRSLIWQVKLSSTFEDDAGEPGVAKGWLN